MKWLQCLGVLFGRINQYLTDLICKPQTFSEIDPKSQLNQINPYLGQSWSRTRPLGKSSIACLPVENVQCVKWTIYLSVSVSKPRSTSFISTDWCLSCLLSAVKKGVDRQAITVWNEMKTPWEWQFDDLRAKLWPPRNPSQLQLADGEGAVRHIQFRGPPCFPI